MPTLLCPCFDLVNLCSFLLHFMPFLSTMRSFVECLEICEPLVSLFVSWSLALFSISPVPLPSRYHVYHNQKYLPEIFMLSKRLSGNLRCCRLWNSRILRRSISFTFHFSTFSNENLSYVMWLDFFSHFFSLI